MAATKYKKQDPNAPLVGARWDHRATGIIIYKNVKPKLNSSNITGQVKSKQSIRSADEIPKCPKMIQYAHQHTTMRTLQAPNNILVI